MKENWIDQIRQKLEGHEATPPKGLWEDICHEMGLTPEPASKPAVSKRWLWAAAASIVALTGFFAVERLDETPSASTPQVAEVQTEPKQQETLKPQAELEPATEPLAEAAIAAIKPKPTVKLIASVSQEKAPEAEAFIETETPIETEVPIETEPQTTKQTELPIDYEMTTSETSPRSYQASSHKWSIGLNASGGLLAANNSVYRETDRLYMKNSVGESLQSDYDFYNFPYTNFSSESMSYTQTEYVWKHRLPLRLGLSLQYQLNNRLALLSGLNYTYLYSEFSIPLYKNNSYDQKLHYLGIPLGIAWQVWSTNRFHVYLSGSAMLEKCISSEISGQTSLAGDDKKPWQWSVQAAAGAEYLFVPQFGAYLEPSLGYYFDDGTNVQHYYKEHPFAPSIEFGLRLHLKK